MSKYEQLGKLQLQKQKIDRELDDISEKRRIALWNLETHLKMPTPDMATIGQLTERLVTITDKKRTIEVEAAKIYFEIEDLARS